MNIEPTPWIDLTAELQDKHIVSCTLDYSGRLFVLAMLQPLDYYVIKHNGTSTSRLRTNTPHDYVIIEATENYTRQYNIPNQYWNYHFIQPLPDDELLLACARAIFRRKDDFDLNASVFTHEGELKREFLLGDGIRHLQTTQNGAIWTGYFDEGVFGNYGWYDPVGEPGLIKWDQQGNKLYTFQPSGGIDFIADCYALNVVSNTETWLYYYTKFPLVRLVNGQVKGFWNTPIHGSHAFATWRYHVLFCGGYEDRLWHLYRLGDNETMIPIADYNLDSTPDELITRSNRIVIRHGYEFSTVDMAELVR
jgi:hypothetical protein